MTDPHRSSPSDGDRAGGAPDGTRQLGRDRLEQGESLAGAQTLTSPNGRVVLGHDERGVTWLTLDGQRSTLAAVWVPESTRLTLDPMGVLRLVSPAGASWMWNYGRYSWQTGSALVVQDDGDVVLVDGQGAVTWRTETRLSSRRRQRSRERKAAELRRTSQAGTWLRTLDLDRYSITLVRGLDQRAALTRIGASAADIGPMTVAEAQRDAEWESLRCIVAVNLGEQTMLIEPLGEESLDDVTVLSEDGGEAVVSSHETVKGHTWIRYAKDGIMVLDAHDERPDATQTQDKHLTALIRKLDRSERWDDVDAEVAYPAHVQLACLLAQVEPTPDDVTGPHLGARINVLGS